MRSSIIMVALLVAGCGGADLSCSTNQTRELVQQIARGEAKRDAKLDFVYDLEKSEFPVKDIVTTEKSAAKTSCKAVMEMKLVVKRHDFATEPAKNPEFPITYNVERTDDGRLYVTVYGL